MRPNSPPGDHGHVVGHATFIEIGDQRTDRLIEIRKVVTCIVEVRSMPIPKAIAERHATRTRFHQSAREQKLLIQPRGRVSLLFIRA